MDPKVLEAFIKCQDKFKEIFDQVDEIIQ